MSEMDLFNHLVNGGRLMRANPKATNSYARWDVLFLSPNSGFVMFNRLTTESYTPDRNDLKLENWVPCEDAYFSNTNPEWREASAKHTFNTVNYLQDIVSDLKKRIDALENKLGRKSDA